MTAAQADLLTQAGHEVIPYVAENPTGALPTAASLDLSASNLAAARARRSTVTPVRRDVALLSRNGRPSEDCVGILPWPGAGHRSCRGSVLASAAGPIAASRTS